MNYELANDTVAYIPITTLDAAGAVVPAPSGDAFSAASSNPASLTAAIGVMPAGSAIQGPALVLTPLVQASPGLTVTITDTAGLTSDTQDVDIVQDLTPKSIGLNLTGATTTPQAVPTNPGP